MEALHKEVPEWVTLEHRVAKILTKQELHGWYFDERSAQKLECELPSTLDTLQRSLRQRHPFVAGDEFTPSRANATRGYIPGCTFTRLKDLNPTSRDHIAWVMKTFYGWKPNQFTDKGKATIDEVCTHRHWYANRS